MSGSIDPASQQMTQAPAAANLNDLIARCALRDRQAFAALYDATSAKLFSVILRILGREAVAEETLQEIYLKIWEKAGDYHSGKGQPMTWLISIARYRAIDVLRAQSRRDLPGSPDALEVLADQNPGPAQRAEQDSRNSDLDSCLGDLPEPRGQCLRLAYCEGYTHEELSERLGSPVGTIKSWIRRGLIALRDCLEALHG